MRPRTLGEILSAAFDIYKTNASKLLLIVAVVVVPLSFLGALLGQAFAGSDEKSVVVLGQTRTVTDRTFAAIVLGGLIALVVTVIISSVLQAAILRATAQTTIGDPVDVEASYRWGLKRVGSVLLVGVLVGLSIFVGFFLLLVGAIIFGVFLSMSIPVLVIENRRGREALKRSWQLVSGHFWHVLGVLIVAGIITGVISSVIRAFGGSNWVAGWIFSAIAQIITAPFSALVSVLLYLDLRARKEALTADSLRTELASSN
jgi:hypothetical protein